MPEFIYFNGEKYRHPDEMPSPVRQDYEQVREMFADADSDGVPDIAHIQSLADMKGIYQTLRTMLEIQKRAGPKIAQYGDAARRYLIIRETEDGIYVNERRFDSPEEMPQDLYEFYDAIANDRGGLLSEAKLPAGAAIPPADAVETTTGRMLLIIAAVLLIGAIAIGLWMILL